MGVLLVLPCEPSLCADAGPLVISVPEGFDGPTRTDEAGGVAIGWVKRLPGKEGGTLLQVSAVDVGASMDGITPAQRAEATRHYLLEFIGGIRLRRKDFELGDIEQVSLAGARAMDRSRRRYRGDRGHVLRAGRSLGRQPAHAGRGLRDHAGDVQRDERDRGRARSLSVIGYRAYNSSHAGVHR
jgi:hypothetical protein